MRPPKPWTRRPVTRPRPSDPRITRRNVEVLRRFEFEHIPT